MNLGDIRRIYTVAILKANMNIEQAFEQSLIELESKEFDAIREHERVLATIWAVEAEVNNGGFDQLFYNSAGDISFYAAKAFDAIGAHNMASIAQKAQDLFGPEGPPKNRDERVEILESISEKHEEYLNKLDYEFTEYPDNIKELLLTYVQSNF
ncbi:DMP19 family protein [Shewanella decolorationis]|uniref:DMP19 family protein n=1 Tax=Shewanella decolorationis TaxID=256839 RepID=UPI001057170F|nr:DMP19 family protein [Shewanella decolorationis]